MHYLQRGLKLLRELSLPVLLLLVMGCGKSKPTSLERPASDGGPVQVAKVEEPSTGREDRGVRTSGQPPVDVQPSIEDLRSRLLQDASDIDARMRLAIQLNDSGQLKVALDLLDGVPGDHPAAGIAALAFASDWAYAAEEYEIAESKYRSWLSLQPESPQALRPLAFILNRQGRRHEAVPLLQTLCRLGDVTEDELVALVAPVEAIFESPENQATANAALRDAAGESASVKRWYTPIGVGGLARQRFTENQFAEAADLLGDTTESLARQPSLIALRGRCLAEAGQDEEFVRWHQTVTDDVKVFPDYWAGLATHLINSGEPDQAAHALLETLRRDPHDPWSVQRMMSVMRGLERDEDGKEWTQRRADLQALRGAVATFNQSPSPSAELYIDIAQKLLPLQRNLEAIYWRYLGAQRAGTLAENGPILQQTRRQILASQNAFPSIDFALSDLKDNPFPVPKIAQLEKSGEGGASPSVLTHSVEDRSLSPSWEGVARSVGLDHVFKTSSQPQADGFAIYQTLGGGVAVTDFELDGVPDLMLACGGADPPHFQGPSGRRLWRCVDGHFVDVSSVSGIETTTYSIGVTAGDFNCDGLPDLVEGTLLATVLWLNQGDGTFVERQLPGIPEDTVTASLAIADLNGDAIPDLYEASYVQGPEITRRPRRDSNDHVVHPQNPRLFTQPSDRLYLQAADGELSVLPLGTHATSAAGLGVVVGDFGIPGERGLTNDVLVGNDVGPNHLWLRSPEGNWQNAAFQQGIAYSGRGEPTASMGIAAADLDGSGTLDFFVTNFKDEANNLFLRQKTSYRDWTFGSGLGESSVAPLGFGTQPIDWDNDGDHDLFIANGGVDRLRGDDASFRQLPQAMLNRGGRFERVGTSDANSYLQAVHVGRSVASLDFNRDGLVDHVITHLNEPTELLVNRTEARLDAEKGNHFLRLRLVGTQSSREAIGAIVSVQMSSGVKRFWMTAGDGYLCRNEGTIHVGMSESMSAVLVTVQWPSGLAENYANLRTDSSWLIVEGHESPFEEK